MSKETESTPEIRSSGTAAPSSEPRRGPGRPRKDGRPPGSGRPAGETSIGAETAARKGRRGARVELDKVAVARQLMGSHMLAGSMLGMPELFLSEKEAEQMAESLCDFAREYDFTPDPKLMALIQLGATAGFIYVPKVLRMAVRVKNVKAARKGQTVDGVATEVKTDGTSTD